MKHLGDITKLNGAEVPIVDVICGGSPCQDLSVAGKRAGLAGERSGLFMDQIRIIKEMREHDRAIKGSDVDSRLLRPRYMVWENVPGAFSSNSGKDFHAVLEETAKVAERDASIPGFEGKWPSAGCIMGNGWSIAWRVHDAQFWGVPQRRKRIALVADFGGDTAPEILFERESVSRDSAESGEQRQGVAATSERDPVKAISFQERAGCAGGGKGILIQGERTGALSTLNNQSICYGISAYESNAMKSSNPHSGIYEADTSRTLDLNGGSPACNQGGMAVVCLNDQGGQQMNVSEDISGTLRAQANGHQPIVIEGNGTRESHRGDGYKESETMFTLNTVEQHAVCQPIMIEMTSTKNTITEDGISPTLTARMGTGGNQVNSVFARQRSDQLEESEVVSTQSARQYKDATDLVVGSFYPQMKAESQCWREDNVSNMLVNGTNPGYQNGICSSIVRRLTPLECERLQGYPDHWTDIGEWIDSKGKKHKDADSPRYKALGNSIALPFWQWMAKRMVSHLDTDHPTMASLFDGIGGFPLVYSRAGCEPIWASEIEEFPIAVTKCRFPERSEDE